LLHLDHAQVALRLVVIKRDRKIEGEPEHRLLPLRETIKPGCGQGFVWLAQVCGGTAQTFWAAGEGDWPGIPPSRSSQSGAAIPPGPADLMPAGPRLWLALPWFSCPAAGLSSRLSQGCLSSSSCFMLLLSQFCRSFCHGIAHLNRYDHFIIREIPLVVFVGPASWESAADHQMTRLLDTDLWYKTGFEAFPNLSP